MSSSDPDADAAGPDLSPRDDDDERDVDADDVTLFGSDADAGDEPTSERDDAVEEDVGTDADREDVIETGDADDDAGDDEEDDDAEDEQRPGVVTATTTLDATWSNARGEYETAGENGEKARTKRQMRNDARLVAAKTILYEHDVATEPRDSNGQRGEMYLYDPETGLYEDGGEEQLRNVIEEKLGQYVSTKEKTEIVDKVYDRADTFEDGEWDGEHDERTLVPAKNGVIHVEALNDPDAEVLLDYTPEMRFRWQLAVDFKPSVDAGETRFAEFLDTMQPDDVQRETILGFVGAALVEEAPDGFLMLVGEGSNGKTMIQTGIERLFGGSDADQVATEDLQDISQNRFAMGQLVRARVNLAPDISATRIEDASNLKKITGGDSLSAGRKRERRQQIESAVTLIASANSPPMMPSEQHAIQRRIYYAHFEREFVHDPDPSDPSQLQARPEAEVKEELFSEESLEGLLALAVQELARVKETGEYAQGREMSPSARLDAYQALADTAARFARELLEADEGAQVLKDDMHQVYQSFARAQGETPMRKSAMTRTLQNLEGLDVTTKRTRTFSDGDDRNRVFEHVSFSADAREHMTDRIEDDYLDAASADDADDGEEERKTRKLTDAVVDVVDEMSSADAGAPAGMVTTTVAAALGDGVDEGRVGRAIESLEQDARLYRPAEGELMLIQDDDQTDDDADDDGDDSDAEDDADDSENDSEESEDDADDSEDADADADPDAVKAAVADAVAAHAGAPTRSDVAEMAGMPGDGMARLNAVDDLLSAGELAETDDGDGLATTTDPPGRVMPHGDAGGDADV